MFWSFSVLHTFLKILGLEQGETLILFSVGYFYLCHYRQLFYNFLVVSEIAFEQSEQNKFWQPAPRTV
jgi:hypothetical protein